MKTTLPTHRRLLSRRGLLRGAGMVALLAPVLRQLDALAQPALAPRRVILIYSPNGPMLAAGPASGAEQAFTLHPWWRALDRHREVGIFLSHMAPTGAGIVEGAAHGLGGQVFGGFGAQSFAPKGPTIDYFIGKALAAQGRAGVVPSVVWGNQAKATGGGTWDAFVVRTGSGQAVPVVPETSPTKAWGLLFKQFSGGTGTAQDAIRLARDKSMLDFVATDCEALRDSLGTEGLQLLAEHCERVRALERNLNATLIDGCVKPPEPAARDWTNPANCDPQCDAFFDLMAAALACELTHVVAWQFGAQAARNRIAPSYGVPSSPRTEAGDSGPAHHPWTHQDGSPAKQTALRIFYEYYSGQVSRLLDKLRSTNDASGKPLLDSTVVVWLSELGGHPDNTDYHQTGCLPVLLFGSGQGTFRTGRYLKGKSTNLGRANPQITEAGKDTARLLVSVMRYMGLAVNTVGATGVQGGLEAL